MQGTYVSWVSFYYPGPGHGKTYSHKMKCSDTKLYTLLEAGKQRRKNWISFPEVCKQEGENLVKVSKLSRDDSG